MKNVLNTIKHVYNVTHSVIREAIKSKSRSSMWPHVRKAFLLKNPSCAACGSAVKLQVHHVKPFHLYPQLELEESNLITLCMDKTECHLKLGHGDNFKCWNADVVRNAAEIKRNPARRLVIEKIAEECRKK